MLVVQLVNSPYFAPLVELVKSFYTSSEDAEKAPMKDTGQKPTILLPIQYVVLLKCYLLIADSVQDIDAVMSEAHGMRYCEF